jgi:hypothetical protein
MLSAVEFVEIVKFKLGDWNAGAFGGRATGSDQSGLQGTFNEIKPYLACV